MPAPASFTPLVHSPDTLTAQANGRYSSATALIVGDTVEVTSGVSAPKAVRYGFSSGANLGNNVNVSVEGGASTVTQLPGSLFELKFP